MIINTCLNYTILLSLIFYVNDKKTLKQTDSSSKTQTKNYPVLCLVILSHPTLCDPMDCSPPGSSAHGILQARYWSGLPCPPPGDLLNQGIEPRSTLQADSLPSEPPGKTKNTGIGSQSLLQGVFPTQESNRGLLHCRKITYQLRYW